MEFIVEEGKRMHQDCSTLILPALSVGNVGQLAVDLLVSSMGAERVGYLDDPFMLPCVGNDAYGPLPCGEIALPLEVYDSLSNGITLVQQRSPVVKGMMINFAKNIADFASASGKKHVVILSSLDFQKLQKLDMSSGSQVNYLSSTKSDGTDDQLERIGFKRLDEYDPTGRCWRYLSSVFDENSSEEMTPPSEDELEDIDYYPSLPFAALFSAFKARGLKVTCLLCYCSEGDNIPEAFLLAESASKLTGLGPDNFRGGEDGKWRIPCSWKSLYGAPPDSSMF
ncbi:PREDICTED: proteasome assembly chaperone 2 [Tarenaya hassleriana]|uniref:proteasome assembly chaperone 2 n=1 Tax=Tarenaya hassleriana TaxID=28532 RepID=UPI00053C1CFA|nr:PREDICTED: proteasome assembly chaperone 2 [Tarenaya hassleriana]